MTALPSSYDYPLSAAEEVEFGEVEGIAGDDSSTLSDAQCRQRAP